MYNQFTKETRIMFSGLLKAGLSLRAAARILEMSHSSLSRELRRNPPVRADWSRYHPGDAQRTALARRQSANQRFRKILPGSELEQLIVQKITVWKWGPEQIAGWLNANRRRLSVCAQTIYDWIYTRARHLLAYLHCRKGKYRRTRQSTLRKQQRQRLSSVRHISNRPPVVESRDRYGDWEGDTVHGKKHSGYIATFVERRSGYLMAALLPKGDFGSAGFASAAKQCFGQLPPRYRKTLTLDNGPEMKLPEAIERSTGMQVYYATPYHSWERGTNENTNGLLRYFFPKQSSFAALTQEDIDQAVRLLNTRPRKRLGYRSPVEMLKV
jgi:IS30 family transposase